MDKDIKLLLKIIGICLLITFILFIIFFGFFFFSRVNYCYKTCGNWMFEEIDNEECVNLEWFTECRSNPKCFATGSSEGRLFCETCSKCLFRNIGG
ncbi:hypothetical protein KAJ87_02490 [Candidatus Pacearchaeota archaeon]|nr:hypothetical protein [Candidatus Pacearchaeota archaeon]